MLDEPTSALDFGNQIKVMHVARRLSRQGYSVVLTTHTPDHAIMLNGTVGILDRAGNMTVGSVDEIVTEEALSETYQTDAAITYVEAVRRRSCLALFSEDD